MDTSKLKNFAQYARRYLREIVNSKLQIALAQESAARRENPKAVEELEMQIQLTSEDQVIEKVAYIWFNRFCALRFMDVNRYNKTAVLSPLEGQFQPEILTEIKMGVIDETIIPQDTATKIVDLIQNRVPSDDPQNEAYRLIVVAVCNHLNTTMPFLFQRIADYTELLMPDDLLSGNSIISYVREAMTPEACVDVEVIGWLYQFYISEKKDEVFAGLKKNKKVTPENIPAATQLFTPNWIVRYLVENSLGRLWMLNHPNSRLIDKMDYYIKPIDEETDFLVVKSPEEIKICDPACGSGHMLVYAFEILYAIYEEEGYDAPTIPKLILENNLYGIEIDERAGELAAFALCMKAREKYRRFFKKNIQPNICVLENITFENSEVKSYLEAINPDLYSEELSTLLYQFKEADNFGSLIRPAITDIPHLLGRFDEEKVSDDLFLKNIHERVLKVMTQADYLSPKYHVVVANPPYMGGKGMNPKLKTFLQNEYSNVKSDLFSAFIVRNTQLALSKGQLGFMTPFVWMFISSYVRLREYLITQKTITSLIQLEYSGFDGATVPICTFTIENEHNPDIKGSYVRLSDFRGSENQGPRTQEAIRNPHCGWFYRSLALDFKKIPESPIAYWANKRLLEKFETLDKLSNVAVPKKGLVTSDNNRFLKKWFEVSSKKIGFNLCSRKAADESQKKWFPINAGGAYRKWFGNAELLINWENDGKEIISYAAKLYGSASRQIQNTNFYFKPCLTWSNITSAEFGARYSPAGFIFGAAGTACIPKKIESLNTVLAFLNSLTAQRILKILNPTLNFVIANIASLPFDEDIASSEEVQNNTSKSILIARKDWNSYEISWDFFKLPLLHPEHYSADLKSAYTTLRNHWQETTLEMQRLEEENNRIFIKAYGLEDELTPEVPLHEITLTCNPHYRYAQGKTDEEYEALQKADTMKELISYSVGCMMGRYSLDEPGLIYAHSANVGFDPSRYKTFPADDDGVIPIMDVDWFPDDMAERFKKFLKVTFGEELYGENLEFIEKAIGKDIRKFFLKDFYTYHVKMYKKRPIYWLFSSPKGSFNALIYLHRYRPDTVSVVLNDYLREFRTKLAARKENLENISISTSASQREKTKALKEVEKLKKVLDEVDEYERDILYPLATKQIEIDLDDGVKVNYPKFGKALKKIAGLS